LGSQNPLTGARAGPSSSGQEKDRQSDKDKMRERKKEKEREREIKCAEKLLSKTVE